MTEVIFHTDYVQFMLLTSLTKLRCIFVFFLEKRTALFSKVNFSYLGPNAPSYYTVYDFKNALLCSVLGLGFSFSFFLSVLLTVFDFDRVEFQSEK